MGSMGFMITVSVLLIVGAVVGVVAQRRTQRNRPPSDLDAEAEANHWLVRLGGVWSRRTRGRGPGRTRRPGGH